MFRTFNSLILNNLKTRILSASFGVHSPTQSYANCIHCLSNKHRPTAPLQSCILQRRAYSKNLYSSKQVNLVTPMFIQAERFADRVAVVDQHGSHTYEDLLHFTNRLADQVISAINPEKQDLLGENIAFLCPNDVSYVISQWATWMTGAAAVPLSRSHPQSELAYFIADSRAKLVITTEEYEARVRDTAETLGVRLLVLGKSDYLSGVTDVAVSDGDTDSSKPDSEKVLSSERHARYNRLHQLHKYNKYKYRNSLIVYTSGTTGKPKGVVHTHGTVQAQMTDMVSSWGWKSSDVILHVLPLHHIHGIVNVLMTALYTGATCVMLPTFDPSKVWSTLLSPVAFSLPRSVNVLMAVPTIYAKLIDNYDHRLNRGRGTRQAKEYVRAVCTNKIRLMVSGSAALPQPVMERWEEITGHRLLERYGMTELGMALTNPLRGTRHPGAVGMPFPKVEVAIARPNAYSATGFDIIVQGDSRHTKVVAGYAGEEGELLVRGPNVFKEYWGKPEHTNEAFTDDKWFKTGDTACYRDGTYRILGRTSVDIIKSGGYKISALDIERHLLSHPDITDVAVVGLPDITWGQKVAAVVVFREGAQQLTLQELRDWAKDKMSTYQLPSVLKVMDAMPRNAMGKVNKKHLLEAVFEREMKQNL